MGCASHNRVFNRQENSTHSGRVNMWPLTRLHIDEGVSALGLIWPSLDHSWITHSRKRTVPRGNRRTRSPRHLSPGGPQRSRQDTRGNGADTVRDHEAPGSNPGPPAIVCLVNGSLIACRSRRQHGPGDPC
jgi:hypothetical protein